MSIVDFLMKQQSFCKKSLQWFNIESEEKVSINSMIEIIEKSQTHFFLEKLFGVRSGSNKDGIIKNNKLGNTNIFKKGSKKPISGF